MVVATWLDPELVVLSLLRQGLKRSLPHNYGVEHPVKPGLKHRDEVLAIYELRV